MTQVHTQTPFRFYAGSRFHSWAFIPLPNRVIRTALSLSGGLFVWGLDTALLQEDGGEMKGGGCEFQQGMRGNRDTGLKGAEGTVANCCREHEWGGQPAGSQSFSKAQQSNMAVSAGLALHTKNTPFSCYQHSSHSLETLCASYGVNCNHIKAGKSEWRLPIQPAVCPVKAWSTSQRSRNDFCPILKRTAIIQVV